MPGMKRKEGPIVSGEISKKQKTAAQKSAKPASTSQTQKRSHLEDAADEENFDGFSDTETANLTDKIEGTKLAKANGSSTKPKHTFNGARKPNGESTSAEAHVKQRALAKERKLSKPNANAVQRSKELWERLRRKSHVPAEERKQLVAELFGLIEGRVRDFVFKHDSVRAVQCALKYATQEQRKTIVKELKSDVRTLAESRYGKFLVAKMVVEGDQEIRNTIVPEFYGHVRRLINHPEASWIVDDIYRQIATKQQKAKMLREWYGAEYALFHRNSTNTAGDSTEETADVQQILRDNPEKRRPILQYLLQMINSLVQKKMTGFTMLHDAMLQYFLVLTPDSEEHKEFLEILKGDIDADTEGGGGDLFRNLAFTKSGSRLVCLALAYGSAKDRKLILRVFKDNVETMAFDPHANLVLITGLEVTDDTKMTGKTIIHEYLGQHMPVEEDRLDRLENKVISLDARLPALFPMAGPAKWLVKTQDMEMLEEVFAIRNKTSKKAPEQRRKELVDALRKPTLELVTKRASNLVQSSFGCVFISETLLACSDETRSAAKASVAALAGGDPLADEHIARNSFVSRMLKTLVTGGIFDAETKKVTLCEPRLGFGADLYPIIKDSLVQWACSSSSFVVVAILESDDVPERIKVEARKILSKGRKDIERAANGSVESTRGPKDGPEEKIVNAGAKIILEKLE